MIAFLRGQLFESTPIYAIVDVSGIGYKVFISKNTFSSLPSLEQEVFLFTTVVTKETGQTLYGFKTVQERELFEQLIQVAGVGPKIALSVIGHLSPKELFAAIKEGDLTTLCRVPGIGKKGAERIAMELRDKMQKMAMRHPEEFAIHLEKDPKKLLIMDAMNALVNLGYTQNVAEKAIKKSLDKNKGGGADLAALITDALKFVG